MHLKQFKMPKYITINKEQANSLYWRTLPRASSEKELIPAYRSFSINFLNDFEKSFSVFCLFFIENFYSFNLYIGFVGLFFLCVFVILTDTRPPRLDVLRCFALTTNTLYLLILIRQRKIHSKLKLLNTY